MIVPKSERIDLNRPQKTTVYLSQDDNTREIFVSLYRDQQPYDVTADASDTVVMAVQYIYANGYGDSYAQTQQGEAAVEQDANTRNLYKVRIDGAATERPGRVDILVKFSTDAGQVLHSFPITLDVKRSKGSDVDPDGTPAALSRYVRADRQTPATEGMTEPVGYDAATGQLKVAPSGGGGGTVTGAVRYDTTQSLTSTQKSRARTNIGAGTGTYSKPTNGIPATDFEPAVQTSLGKADTALQSVSAANIVSASGDLTVQQAADVRENIGAGTYSKPNTGIPASDMASAVQTALTAAGTAVQPSTLDGYVPITVFAAVTPSADLVEVKRDAQTGKLYVLVNGSTPAPSGDSNTTLITMTESGADLIASKTASEIYTILSGGAVNLVLIDYASRQGTLVKKPTTSGGGYTDAKFWAFDENTTGIIEYSINSSGVVSYTTIPLAGFYTKPSGGIPQTDLATALSNKINGALQTANLTAKTSAMTQDVGYDSSTGKLYTAPGSGGSYTPETVTLTMTVGATTTDLSVALSYADLSAKIAAGARLVSQMTVGYDTVGIEWRVNGGNTTQQGIYLYTIFEDATGENLLIAYLSETGTDEMSGVVESHPVGNAKNPTITPVTGTSPSAFSLADNTIYECGTLTALTITSAPASGSSIITFTSGATATTASFPATVLFSDDQPDVTSGVFVPSANYDYEINVRNRKALISRWAVSA